MTTRHALLVGGRSPPFGVAGEVSGKAERRKPAH
jgi:hypothetical protein